MDIFKPVQPKVCFNTRKLVKGDFLSKDYAAVAYDMAMHRLEVYDFKDLDDKSHKNFYINSKISPTLQMYLAMENLL